ncbi:lovastatin nonaketide synthase [Aspergillus udagawae]|uniref:Lovastatin nonaketide synthase n=1 Tax=Aspergillus udagawae TaxID=91492 RepID=A0A8H3XQM3_9EURO|nr:lovastatin nonaketide synthase [Aspergillus udagawae]
MLTSYGHSDITRLDHLQDAHRLIQTSYPPIAGVVIGAVILQDKLFDNCDLETFEAVLAPKVSGINNLDQIFHSQSLEFFIAFSSLSATLGNAGQTAYAAANTFMKAIIACRRARGVSGSTMDISRVVGVGGLRRAFEASTRGDLQMERLKRKMAPMSERDLHQMFAEAILAGRPSSNQNPELIAGVMTYTDRAAFQDGLRGNPRFFRFLVPTSGDAADESRLGREGRSIRGILTGGASPESVSSEIQLELIEHVRRTLRLGGEIYVDETKPLVELGVDSFTAVDISKWIQHNLSLDMPVMRILGGLTVAEVVSQVIGGISD